MLDFDEHSQEPIPSARTAIQVTRQLDGKPGIFARATRALKNGVKWSIGGSTVWSALAPVRPAGAVVLTYHRVGAEDDVFPNLDIGLFKRQMEWAARHCDLIGPEDLRKRALQPTRRRAVLVTFDDGFRGYYDHVYPLLQRMGIPAVVFVTTGLIDDPGRLLWADTAREAVRQGAHLRLSLPWQRDNVYDLRDGRSRDRFLKAFKAHAKDVPEEEKESHLAWLCGAVGYSPFPTRQMLSWDEVRSTISLTTFAGHSHTHPILSRVSDAQLDDEVRLSRDRIREETGKTPTLFAYPNGRPSDFDDRCRSALKRYGFDTAFTTDEGINGSGTDWYAVARISGEVDALDFPWILSGLRAPWFSRGFRPAR